MITNTLYRSLARWPKMQKQARRALVRLPSRRRMVKHMGLNLIVDPTELTGHYIYYERAYDQEVFSFLRTRLDRYQRVLDIGANIGVYTVFFARQVARVDAFEPVPELATWLRKNLALNKLENVTINQCCISDLVGTTHFTRASRGNLGIGRISAKESGCEVHCSTLDAFLGGAITEPTLIKMDIEGSEWMALRGASRVLSNRHARLDLLLEIHPDEIKSYGGSITRLADLLHNAGFTLHSFSATGLSDVAFAPTERFWFAEAN